MGKRGEIRTGEAYMELSDGATILFYTVTDLGLATQKVVYHVDLKTRQQWDKCMMGKASECMRDFIHNHKDCALAALESNCRYKLGDILS